MPTFRLPTNIEIAPESCPDTCWAGTTRPSEMSVMLILKTIEARYNETITNDY
jgi:hypothetical protein